MDKPRAPKFLEHHVPTPQWALVPDCLCDRCAAVRRAWGDVREADGQASPPTYPGRGVEQEALLRQQPDYWPGLPTYREWKLEQAREAVRTPAEAPAMVERDLACPTCRRAFCRVRAPEGTPITVLCPGCALEGR